MRLREIKKLIENPSNNLHLLLSKLLQTDYFKSYSDDENISLSTLVFYLETNYNNLLNKSLDKNQINSDIMNLFLNSPLEIKQEASSIVIADNNVKLSLAPNITLFQDKQDTKMWEDKFILLGCHKKIITNIFANHVIKNPAILYKAVSRFEYPNRRKLKAWELYCLSGELSAIRYAVKHENLNQYKDIEGSWDPQKIVNPLFLMALSGVITAVDFGITVLKICPQIQNEFAGMNMTHYAAWSGNIETISFCLQSVLPHNVKHVREKNSFNGYLLRSGSLETYQHFRKHNNVYYEFDHVVEGKSLALFKILTDGLTKISDYQFYKVAKSGEISLIDYCIHTFKSDPHYKEYSRTPLTGVMESCNLETLKYFIENIKVNPQVTPDGKNLFHWAASLGWVPGMRYARDVLNISPHDQDESKRNGLYYACKSGNIEAIFYCIEELKMDPELIGRSGDINAIKLATLSDCIESVVYLRLIANREQIDFKIEDWIKLCDKYPSSRPYVTNYAEIKKILEIPIEQLIAQEEASRAEAEGECKINWAKNP